jgi:hypothetical protein
VVTVHAHARAKALAKASSGSAAISRARGGRVAFASPGAGKHSFFCQSSRARPKGVYLQLEFVRHSGSHHQGECLLSGERYFATFV